VSERESVVNTNLEQRVKNHLCQVYELDLEGVQELYEIGHDTVTATVRRMHAAFSGGDLQDLGDAGHMLKGTLFNMGLTEEGELARSLELACREGRADEVRGLFGRLKEVLAGF
jgi:HPt (histidine-containing phosphotransfer) domain-containing protein